MRWNKVASLLLVGCAAAAPGCIEYHIAAPNDSIVLVRGKGPQVRSRAEVGLPALIQQRQFGLLGGLIFISDEKFSHTVQGAALQDVGIVTGKHASDMALLVVSSLFFRIPPIFTSHTIRVYADVE